MAQSAEHRCEDCGKLCAVSQSSPYEFDWRCACGNAGSISWAHANEPPSFKAVEATPTQQGLFDEATT